MTKAHDDRWLAGDAYEAFMGRWSRRLAPAFVTWVTPTPGGRWLDVGCGTGALASAICTGAAPRLVVACDPSEAFVRHGRQHLADARVSFVVARAEALPVREGAFDAGVSALVLNFIPDPLRAVAALGRRLRAGGVAAACVWDYAGGMEFLRRFWDEAVAMDAAAAGLDEGRRFPLCSAPALAALFDEAGFSAVETAPIEVETVFADFEDYWTPFLRGTGPAPAYVASLDPIARAALRDRLRARLLAPRGGPIALRARAWAVRGIQP